VIDETGFTNPNSLTLSSSSPYSVDPSTLTIGTWNFIIKAYIVSQGAGAGDYISS
jgi:hypothetical protein